jgi:poly-gamma-glutamate synthesis protein (capsule biosynthesis protein)
VFTGPPEAAPARARARIDVVSLANNHAWDYGKAGLFETMDRLEAAGVRWVGAGKDVDAAYRPLVVDHDGFRLAFLAVTDIWNQGVLSKHPGREHVARADPDALAAAVRALRSDATIDAIAVSYHGGSEYIGMPLERTKTILRGAIDAGADIVIGHHPHVIQGVEWRRGRPILYSLGNFLMRMHSNHAWTGMAFLARIRLARGAPPSLAACPFRIHGVDAIPLSADGDRKAYERQFFDHLALVSKSVGGTRIDEPDDDGCAALSAP